jgi:zinc transport system substrate-binding protein
VAEVREADLVVHFTHLQPAVDAAIANPKSALDVDRAVPTIKTGNHDDAGDEPSADPHVWLDPIRMITIAKAIRDRLVAIDPKHAAEYRTNTSRLSAQLRRLDTEFRRGLNHCTRHTIVTSHAAFGYLSERYGLTQVPIAGIDPANEPSARQLASIAELVRREKITTIFTEELVSPAVANTVARETGVRTATLDPIEGLADSGQDYRSVMRANLAAIRKANDCT